MREIKFRAWDTKDKEWLFGSPEGFSMFGEMVIMGEWGAAAWRSISDNEPNRYVLQQYTGLKDKNGVEIYEGDILKDSILGDDEVCRVEWYYGGFITNCDDDEHGIGYDSLRKRGDLMEVIGNIYENPELLK